MNYSTIFFDLDDTLHDHLKPFDTSLQKLLSATYNTLYPESVYKKFRHYSDLLWNDYSQRRLSLENLRLQRIILTLKEFNIEINNETAYQFQQIYELETHHLSLFPEVIDLFNNLRQQNIGIGIITNGPVEHQLNKINQLGLSQHIPRELMFISDDVGYAKPDRRLFNHVSNKIHVSPQRLIYVGDSWGPDIEGSYHSGWSPIWYNHRNRLPKSPIQPLLTITNLMDILTIIT